LSEYAVQSLPDHDASSPTRWLLSHFSQHKLLFLVLFVGALGNAALAAVIPILVGQAFDAIILNPPHTQVLVTVSVGIVVSQTVRALLQFGRNFASAVIGERSERDMREELYVSLLGKSMTFHDLQPVGDTMARATNDVHEVNLMVYPGINLVVGSAWFMIMPLVLAPRYDWLLTIPPAFFIVGYAWALQRYLGVLSGISDMVRESFGLMNSRLAESIDGVEMVKGSSQEQQETQLFKENAGRYRDAAIEQGKVEARFLPLLMLGVTQAFGFALALWLYQNGRIAVGDVVAYMGLLALFGFPTFVSLNAYSRISLGMAGARRILSTIVTRTDLDENSDGYAEPMQGAVQFDHVYFGYVPGVDVLKDISFSVAPGQTVALVGQTGSGKSTLAKLINRTYDAREGVVLVDDVNVRDWQLAALRRQISFIEQDIFLFSRSIAENIAFGHPGISDEAVVAAAQAAQAHDFIMSFQDGYDTIIGERGATLSGGQKQRIALARAFLTDPRILVLDDSTSAVDSATEDMIQRAIQQATINRTTILITHRLSQIRWADLVLVMRNGRLEAVGDHETLMRESEAYRRIFEQYEALED
jgi:ATP-binding cassette subfamily B protein